MALAAVQRLRWGGVQRLRRGGAQRIEVGECIAELLLVHPLRALDALRPRATRHQTSHAKAWRSTCAQSIPHLPAYPALRIAFDVKIRDKGGCCATEWQVSSRSLRGCMFWGPSLHSPRPCQRTVRRGSLAPPCGHIASLAASLRSKASSAHATDAAQAAPMPSESPQWTRTDETRLEGRVTRQHIIPKHRTEQNLAGYRGARFSDAVLRPR